MRKPTNIPRITCRACDGEGYELNDKPEPPERQCTGCDGAGSVELPWEYEVCPQCEGRGTSSAYLGAFASSEWAEQDDDFREDYIGGKYDRQCETCRGLRVVAEVNRERCLPWQLEQWDKDCQERADEERCRRAESAWGYDRGHGY